jgi:hypothetical protein
MYVYWGRHIYDGSVEGPTGTFFMLIDEHGGLISQPTVQSFVAEVDMTAEKESLLRSYMVSIHPSLLAISFMHCKNVRIVDEQTPPRLAKKLESKKGYKPAAFKTLVIEPLKQILRREGKSDQVGLQKAMHICRGHFRDYRTGPGLFGKYHQLVWTPQTVRGTTRNSGDKLPPREIDIKV